MKLALLKFNLIELNIFPEGVCVREVGPAARIIKQNLDWDAAMMSLVSRYRMAHEEAYDVLRRAAAVGNSGDDFCFTIGERRDLVAMVTCVRI